MVGLRLKLRNVKRFEAQIRGGVRRMSNAAMDRIESDANNLVESVVKRITSSSEYQELRTNPFLRGQLGLPEASRKSGGDTDAEDLVKELRNTKISRTRGAASRRVTISFPTIEELKEALVIRFTQVTRRGVVPGRTQSWFDWWEFGDQGQVDTLTVFKRGAVNRSRINLNRVSLNRLIDERSRSGFALQLPSLPANDSSHIQPGLVVSKTYDNFAKIYPARVSRIISTFVRETNGRSFGFFASARVT